LAIVFSVRLWFAVSDGNSSETGTTNPSGAPELTPGF
jgi:hypothetical protein